MDRAFASLAFLRCGRCLGCTCGYMYVCACLFPDISLLEIKQASPLTPALSLRSLIGPQSLEHKFFEHHCTPVFFLSFSLHFGFVGWLAGRKAPAHLLYRPRETQLRAKSVQNVKHRWPLTHKWVHGKREGLLCQILQSPLAFFFIFYFSCSPPHLSVQLLLFFFSCFPNSPSSHAFTSHTPLPFPRTPSLALSPSEALPLSSVASGS